MSMIINFIIYIALFINYITSKDFNFLYAAGIFAIAESICGVANILSKILSIKTTHNIYINGKEIKQDIITNEHN